MQCQDEYVDRICEKYNRRHVTAFVRKSAEKRFLSPLGLTLKNVPSESFGNARKRLSREEEFQLFAAMHFLKYKIKHARGAKRRYVDIYLKLRNRIISCNWGLLPNCIRKHTINSPHFDRNRLVGKGNMILIYSADGFDPWMGFKFSTYAHHNICKGFINRPKGRSIDSVPINDQVKDTASAPMVDEVKELWIERLDKTLQNSSLTSQEMKVLLHRFPLNTNNKGKTLAQVAEIIGLTKERIRQIQLQALIKLKKELNDDMILNI